MKVVILYIDFESKFVVREINGKIQPSMKENNSTISKDPRGCAASKHDQCNQALPNTSLLRSRRNN